MEKNYQLTDNDLDLFDLLNIIWNEKLKIFFAILVSIIFAISYYLYQEKSYTATIEIKPVSTKELVKFNLINNFITEFFAHNPHHHFTRPPVNSSRANQPYDRLYLNEDRSFERFLSEIRNYDELLLILEKNETIKEIISNSLKKNQQKTIYDIANSITLSQRSTRTSDHTDLNLVWHDIEEAKVILKEVIKLSEINVKKTYFDDLQYLKEIRKKELEDYNSSRTDYLQKLLKILNQELTNPFLKDDGQDSLVNYKFFESVILLSKKNSYDLLTFLKGPKSIEKEIEEIKNSNKIFVIGFEDETKKLKKLDLDWIDYNLFSINIVSMGISFKRLLMMSIGISLMAIIILILILHEFKLKKTRKKT